MPAYLSAEFMEIVERRSAEWRAEHKRKKLVQAVNGVGLSMMSPTTRAYVIRTGKLHTP